MTDAEKVDAALVEHLSKEVERLEAENAILRQALDRPIQVTSSSATDYQMLTAVQQIQYALNTIASRLPVQPISPI